MVKKENLFEHHLRAQNKLDYVKGEKKPNVECILCSIVKNSPKVKSLKIYQDKISAVSLNLYPYNPGHLMIFPIRHITDFRKLSENEILHIFNLIKKSQDMLSEVYNPVGFNIGLNIGNYSGASIQHLHFHIVPRYENELGYIDIIGKTRIVVEGVSQVFEKLKVAAKKYY
ncbi:MAG: HIT family protein [Promethearchaeota archaeon]